MKKKEQIYFLVEKKITESQDQRLRFHYHETGQIFINGEKNVLKSRELYDPNDSKYNFKKYTDRQHGYQEGL